MKFESVMKNSPNTMGGAGRMLVAAIFAAAMTLGAARAGAQCAPDAPRATLPNPSSAPNDEFGRGVAISGNLAVIGALGDNPAGVFDAGSANIFNAASGAFVRTINNPTPADSDRFGFSVAISDNLALIGAPLDDPGGLSNAGSAYLYNATTGELLATMSKPSPAANDSFGNAVAISGSLAVVGGRTRAAYVLDATTGTLIATLNNPAANGLGDFGASIAITGNVVVVGAPTAYPGGVGAGSAYVFNATTGDLITTLNNPTPADGDNFGYSVAISGNIAIIGAWMDDPGSVSNAGTAYLFNATTGGLITTLNNPNPAANDYFGFSVAISGNVAVVGASADNSFVGGAYIFDATTGDLLSTVTHPGHPTARYFGISVAISGTVAVIGASGDNFNSGNAYVFSCVPIHDFLLGQITDPTGSDLNADGAVDIADLLALAAP